MVLSSINKFNSESDKLLGVSYQPDDLSEVIPKNFRPKRFQRFPKENSAPKFYRKFQFSKIDFCEVEAISTVNLKNTPLQNAQKLPDIVLKQGRM